jgi:hypothetical protein
MPLQEPVRAYRRLDRTDQFYNGIPNRDLTEADWQLLDDDQRQLVHDSGLWTVEPDEKVLPKLERLESQLHKQAERQQVQQEKAAGQPEKSTGKGAS